MTTEPFTHHTPGALLTDLAGVVLVRVGPPLALFPPLPNVVGQQVEVDEFSRVELGPARVGDQVLAGRHHAELARVDVQRTVTPAGLLGGGVEGVDVVEGDGGVLGVPARLEFADHHHWLDVRAPPTSSPPPATG